MITYRIYAYDEKKEGTELIVVKTCYNADEADTYAREMSMDCDWVRVTNSAEHGGTVYIQGRIIN